jgi:hypothetical protein
MPYCCNRVPHTGFGHRRPGFNWLKIMALIGFWPDLLSPEVAFFNTFEGSERTIASPFTGSASEKHPGLYAPPWR